MTVNELRNVLARVDGNLIVGVRMRTWDPDFDCESEEDGTLVAAYKNTSELSNFCTVTEHNNVCLLTANSFGYIYNKKDEDV